MSERPVVDAAERERALDPQRSLIVQAPAGSGKTGLLIQRYLRLLATVSRPEEIFAITFTRKAAAEMRKRVLGALQGAAGEKPKDPNAARTWQLARDALARDAQRGWGVLENPVRLRIQTIDSLSATLARQMPVLSGLGAPPAIVDDARELYREAAERTLALVESDDPIAQDVARVLDHLDGEWNTVRELLEDMLGRRDQWLQRVRDFHADGSARETLEYSFCVERMRILERVSELLRGADERAIVNAARYAAANLAQFGSASSVARLEGIERLPTADEEGADLWVALTKLVLTEDTRKPKFRGTVTTREGFPAGKNVDPQPKAAMLALLKDLAQVDGLCEAFNAVRQMPPAAYSDAQWTALGSMVAILPVAAEQLRQVFAERGEMDFTGIAQHAVRALGTPDAPTDLLLSLDVKVQHLLVDEFQDTSHAQWDLLDRLTAGWEPGDGRTVFLVGDPMQSIYRFREADVALFLRARREGLPQVALDDVRIRTNFRSRAGIVEWVNRHFPNILRGGEDTDEGAVEYAESSPHHPTEPQPAVVWHPFLGTDQSLAHDREAQRVVEIVEAALAEDAEQSIAILVRARTHLDKIVVALRKGKVRFRAVDIEPLEGKQVIQDLLAVTRALSHPADRIAWLGLLRAPWCGMTLADLLALIGSEPSSREGGRRTVWELMHDATRLAALTPDGRVRLERISATLSPYVVNRLRGTLRERVESAWLALGGPACAGTEGDLDDAETFFDQLDELEEAGELPDPTVLKAHLETLYAAPDTAGDARVQIMTIHKAKGLEFDTVIVPGLDRVPRISDRPLFAWKARPGGNMLMAPIRAAREDGEPAYDYLRGLDKAASQRELERLLYVAVTRAAKRLHLMGYARLVVKDGEGKVRPAPTTTLLGKAWSAAREDFDAAIPLFIDTPDPVPEKQRIHTDLRRLDPEKIKVDVPEPACPARTVPREKMGEIEYSWVDPARRHVGTIAHRWLQRIAAEGLARWNAPRIASLSSRVERELARVGIPQSERATNAERVLDVLRGAITDERGRWVLGDHPDARSEYRIRVPGPDGVRLLVIDRIFTTGGRAWIVDYKTSSHEGSDLEGFLDSERVRYTEQMTRYVPAFGGAPGSLGLYFPLVKGWREWDSGG
ncbi:hypothetical protein BWI17_00715 [Betaproteobacteria bacterium GR16-43]|nr:hypothetical protein BWI17_00715 [Betaproteobacteria bacterium GR16-43]